MPADNIVQSEAQSLLDILVLEAIEENLFLGRNEPNRPGSRIFGGQVLAQSLAAAYNTIETLHAHSMHAYFIRPGDVAKPVLYEVERIRDGRSFATRRVVAVQNGEAIFSLDVSFQIAEPGMEHSVAIPNVPLPQELADDYEMALAMDADHPGAARLSPMAKQPRPFHRRSVFCVGSPEWMQPRSHNPTWIRFPQTVQEQSVVRCLLAYVSDMSLVATAILPHQQDTGFDTLQTASLDHALWIHRDVDFSDWLLFDKHTTVAQNARALVHANFFSRSGQLIASVTQEGLLRPIGQGV